MAPDSTSSDRITRAILSDSTYHRVRYERHSYLRQSVPRTLALQSALLALLALILPVYGLYPASTTAFLPSTDPMVASPSVVLLGAFGGGIELLAATLLVGAAVYRARRTPLTESQAHAVIDAEDFARYVGLGTGGVAIVVSMLLFAVGLGGGEAVGSYVATTGRNPFAASGFGVSVGTVALAGFGASVLVFYLGSYLSVRLAAVDR